MKIIILIIILLVFLPSSIAIREESGIEEETIVRYCSNAYELEAVYIHEDKVKFRLNQEYTSLLERRESYRFLDGSRLWVREILEEEAAEGPDRVVFNFYPSHCTVSPEENITEENITDEISVFPLEQVNITPDEAKEDIIAEETEKEEIEIPKESPLQRFWNWIKNLF